MEDFLEPDSDVVEEVPVVDEAVEEEEAPVEEIEEELPLEEVEEEPIAPVDEFEAFEAVDEFEQEEVPAVEEEPAEVVVEEQKLVLDSDEVAIEAGDVLNIEFPADSIETASVEEVAEVPNYRKTHCPVRIWSFKSTGLKILTLMALNLKMWILNRKKSRLMSLKILRSKT